MKIWIQWIFLLSQSLTFGHVLLAGHFRLLQLACALPGTGFSEWMQIYWTGCQLLLTENPHVEKHLPLSIDKYHTWLVITFRDKRKKVVQKAWCQRNIGIHNAYYPTSNYLLEKFAFFDACLLLLFHMLLSDQHIFIVPPKLSNQLWQLKHFFLLWCARNSAKYALLSPHGNNLYKLKIAIFHFNDNWAVSGTNIWRGIVNSPQKTKDMDYRNVCDRIIGLKNPIMGINIRIILIYLKFLHERIAYIPSPEKQRAGKLYKNTFSKIQLWDC